MDSHVWALARMVELRQAGEPARFRVCWMLRGNVRHYWLEIRRADGTIERCPESPEHPAFLAVARFARLPPREGMVEEAPSDPLEPL